MIASRRWTSATPSPDQLPAPSGPRGRQRRVHPRDRVAVRRARERSSRRIRTRLTRPPGRRAPGSPPRTRGTGRASRSSDSACHWTPSTSAVAIALDRLDRPVRAPRRPRAARRRARSTAWWWKELTCCSAAPRIPASRECGAISTVCVVTQPGSVWRWSGQVLVEAAAARDVERLGAAADAEDRQPGGVGAARDLELERVEPGLRRAEVRVALGAVGGRVEVRPAGQADARERRDERGDQAAVDGRQHHRHGAGALERAHVGHPERELVLGRLALGQRVGALRAPDLGCRHADQRRAGGRGGHQCVALSVLQGNRGRDRVADRPGRARVAVRPAPKRDCPYRVPR